MCALAVFLEREGIATVVVGLIRLHIEKIKPPRALWVPFELGRPLGTCKDGLAFQKKVIRRALALLERTDGPVILEDFDEEDPGSVSDPSWREPDLSTASSLAEEVRLLKPLWEQARSRLGRSMIGLSNLSIEQAADFLTRFDTDDPAVNPDDDMSALLRLRFCADDIRGYYMEAALAECVPTSAQVGNWFWLQTRAGATLKTLREQNFEHEDTSKATVCGRFLVPGAWNTSIAR